MAQVGDSAPKSSGHYVKRTQKQKRALVRRYKAFHGCAECGECDPNALDVHHREPERKNLRLSKVMGTGRYTTGGGAWQNLSFDDIVSELAHCSILCANCHRKHTAAERGWGALDLIEPSQQATLAARQLGIEVI